jgi:hypothetical protein
MTQDKARKTATRQRMAATGEPYSVARHAVANTDDVPEDPAAAPRDDDWQAEYRAREQADQARRLAEHAREVAEQARMRAERAEEAATAADEAADLTQEAADLTREWADEGEMEQAQRRADEARAAADIVWSRHHREPPGTRRSPEDDQPPTPSPLLMQPFEGA